MPPTSVHLNGSVNLADAESVMREVSARIPRGLRRIPDGETGDRGAWILFQFRRFQEADGLELRRPAAGAASRRPRIGVRHGAETVAWPDLGYARAYRESYEVFRRLDIEGVVPRGVRLQIEYPTPLASIASFVAEEDRAALEPSYERALFADLKALLRALPQDRVAVQWDVAVEFAMLELPDVWGQQDFDALVDRVARCLDQVPDAVPAGAHLCYGDAGHEHFKQPVSLALQVRMMNAVSERARRSVGWFSITVPQAVRDPAYFTPLGDLRVAETTELYFALVPYHPAEQPAGTTEEQARLIDERLGARAWGICTECGMGRVERDEVPAMLDSHREILTRLDPATG
jgi:hypothetical protein